MTTSLAVLRTRARLNTKPEELPLRAWLDVARKTTGQAEAFERSGNDEGAIMEAVFKHPDYLQSRKSVSADYVNFQDLKQRFSSSIQRCRDLEAKLAERDAAAARSPVANGHPSEPGGGSTPINLTFSSIGSPPTSPPVPSSHPIAPDSAKKGRPISGGLASRMAALQVAGLDVQPAAANVPVAPMPRKSSISGEESPGIAESGPSQTSHVPPHPPPVGPKPRRPLPPTPAISIPPPAAGDSYRPLSPLPPEVLQSARPASAPVTEAPSASILSSPPVPEAGAFQPISANRLTPASTGEGVGGLFPSLSEFDSRFPDVPTGEPAESRPLNGPVKSPKLQTYNARPVLSDTTNRSLQTGGLPSAAGRLSFDVPRSSYARALPRTNAILPDALWQYLQPPIEEQPTLLLLDVRDRHEYEQGHIEAPFCICLEPLTLNHEVQSDRLEASLVISPPREREAFLSRDRFDLVVIYDRQSTTIPAHPPSGGTSEAPKYLYNLYSAIYEREFHRTLRRAPVILVGGYEAWQKYTANRQSSVAAASAKLEAGGRPRQGSAPASTDAAKKTNRRAAIAPSDDHQYGQQSVSRSVVDAITGNPYPNHASTNSLTRSHSSFSGQSPIASPPVAAVPPIVTRQPSGSAPPYDYHPSYAPPPRQKMTIDYPQLSSVPQRPPLAAQPNGSPVRPSLTQVQQFSNFSSPSVPATPFTPISGPSQLANLVNWGDGTVGMTGLKNLGNTCYMNSTLQCLSATVPLARFFKDGSYKRAINRTNPLGTRGALAEAVAQLFGVLWSEQYNFVSPVTFRDAICRFAPQFQGTDQHDSQEFLAFLLDGLHEDLNFVQQKPPPIPYTQEREAELEMLPAQIGGEREWNIYLRRENSVIVAWFQGQYRSQLKCLTCGKTSTTYNNFQYLTLALPSNRTIGTSKVNLESLLNAFVQEEILDKDDAWNCPRCKVARKASKKLSLVRLPPILIIHLKRFHFKGPFSDKIDTPVLFPLYGLDMGPYLPPPLTATVQAQYAKVAPDALPAPPLSNLYDLYAVSEQMGTLSSGHYTAKARSRDQWSEIGDSKVRKCDEHDVRKSVKTAYILFYRRR